MSEREPPPPRITYHSEIERLLKCRSKTYADIARNIGLTSFGAKRSGELLRECASSQSKHIGYDYGFSRALIARILTPDDDKTYKKLLRLSRRDRRMQREKTVSVTDSPIRDERELYAIGAQEAAELLDMSDDYLLRLEQGKRVSNPKKEKHIITCIRNEGERRIQEILHHAQQKPNTVRQLIDWITLEKKIHGAEDRFKQFSAYLPGIGHELLKYIVHGKDMPPLPVIKRILRAGDIELTDELTQDWAYEFAVHERKRSSTDIGRALQCISAETYESRRAFERIHGLSLKKSLERIQRGVRCELKSIHKALRQLHVAEESPRWLWIESLFKEQTILPALRHWYTHMTARALPIDWSPQQLPGLTREESPNLITDKVIKELHHRYRHLPESIGHEVESTAFLQAMDGKSAETIVSCIEENFGATILTANTENLRREEKNQALESLLKKAKDLDSVTFASAPDRIADAISCALEHGITDTHQLICNVLLVERLIQWAFSYNLTIASHYYHTLRRAIEESVQKGTSYEEIQHALKTKIDTIANRDHTMAVDDNAPGIHRAKSKTGRKTKGANNY